VTMIHPTHPGEILREDVIAALGLSVKDAAQRLDISRAALSRVVNGHAAISPELALRLEMAGISTADMWLRLQLNYNLAQTRRTSRPVVKPLGQTAQMAFA